MLKKKIKKNSEWNLLEMEMTEKNDWRIFFFILNFC
jgi:hypothetical protein